MSIYFVETKLSEQRGLLCRLADKLFNDGNRYQIMVDSSSAAQLIDQMLWTFSQNSFIPHAVAAPDRAGVPDEPVLIVVGEKRLDGYNTVLCDTPASLEYMSRFEEAYHFILLDDEPRRQESRQIWQEARNQGIASVHVPHGKAI